jgi:hypothetical protein
LAVAPGGLALSFGLANSAFDSLGAGILAGALAGLIATSILAGIAYAIVDSTPRKRRGAIAMAVTLATNLLYALAAAYILSR